MRHLTLAATLFALLIVPGFARSSGSRSSSRSRVNRSASTGRTHSSSNRCASCQRDGHGKIKRSSSAKHKFERANPCPSTGRTTGPCPGYVIDHVQPLERGGADSPNNMQWQTTAEAKAKDRVE